MTVAEPCIMLPLLLITDDLKILKMSSKIKELQEVAKAVLATTKIVLGAEARHSRVAVVGGLAVIHLTKYRTTAVSIRTPYYNFPCLN